MAAWLRESRRALVEQLTSGIFLGGTSRVSVMAAIHFTLWVFDCVGLTDVKLADLKLILDTVFLSPMKAKNKSIVSARAKMVDRSETIAPSKFDAVVFLTTIGFRGSGSIIKIATGNVDEAIGDDTKAGLTDVFAPGGGVSEVYWYRNTFLTDVAGSIFHEACHLKFQEKNKEEMHNSSVNGQHVRVLARRAPSLAHPNNADLVIFASKVPHAVKLRHESAYLTKRS